MEPIRDMIQQTESGFEQLVGMVQETALNLSAGNGPIKDIGLIVEKLDELFKQLGQIKGCLVDQEEMLKDFIALSSDTNRILVYIIDAMGSSDVVLLGDLLEYELKPRVEQWLNFTHEIGAQVN